MLARALLSYTLLFAVLGSARGQHVATNRGSLLPPIGPTNGPTVEVVTQNGVTSTESASVEPEQIFSRLDVFTSLSAGYDSNSRTTGTAQGSLFTNERITIAYNLPNRVTHLGLVTGIGVSSYIDRRTDVNVFFDLSASRSITRRLSANASVSAVYTSEPDLANNVGTNSFSGNYFKLNGQLAASYALNRRFSLVTSAGLTIVRYENQQTALFTDREQYTLGEQARYILTRATVLTASYNLLYVDYVEAPFDSVTQFARAGFEHSFNSHLNGQMSAGASFRAFSGGKTQVNPNFQGSLSYSYGRTSFGGTGSYGVEQPSTRGVATQTTLRTGLHATHAFTGRISSSLGVTYSHNENQAGTSLAMLGARFSEDIVGFSLSARYQFNRHLTFDLGFTHSEVTSGQSFNDYSRNRYTVGANYSF